MKFNDLNGNGAKDAGEPGLPDWTITLDGTDGFGAAVNLSTTTDADGNYSFTNLNPGSYLVCEQSESGWIQSYPDNSVCSGVTGAEDGGWSITLTSGEADTGNDFGNYQAASKSGMKFNDLNGNGAKDAGEPGLPDWTITLDGTDGFGAAVNLSTTTDADGNYSFTNLNPGSYLVCEQSESGWIQSYPDNSVCSGVTGAEDGGWSITLTSGEADTGNDFGNYQAASKSGTKFNDLNGNGAKDAGEPGLPDWTITLDGTDGFGAAVNLSTTTDADGNYSFTNLNPGSYLVCEQSESGWIQSYPDNSVCSGVTGAEDGGWSITLTSGEADTGNDFGNYQAASKSGMKFNDLNGNGAKDAGEPGLPDWTITLDGTDGFGAAVNLSTTTDADGNYSFTNLNPGSYLVCEQSESGWIQSYPDNSVCSGVTGAEDGGWSITLTSGEADTGNDFGNYQAASKSGMKFNDLNGNGAKDAGEPGLPDWTITLDGTDGFGAAVNLSTTTDADGNYSFTNLNPGSYLVCEQSESGWIQSYPDNSVCSGVTGAEDGGWSITLTSGEADTGNDFGNYQAASKSGTKFERSQRQRCEGRG